MCEISVQVPVKNGGEPFRRFLKSLAAQDFKGKWELIIVDDGSSSPVEREFSRELSSLPDNCRTGIIRMDPGGNRPLARNAALESSTADVALLMDADLEFSPDLLRKHFEVRQSTGADVVMGRRINGWSQDATPWQKWMDTRAMGNNPAGQFPGKYFITGNLSVTNSLLLRAGGFDPEINRYGGEDTEMGLRLEAMDTGFYWEPALSVNHLDHVTVRKHSEKMLEYGGSGLRYTLKKHPAARGLLGSRWVEPVFSSPLYLAPVRIFTAVALVPWIYRFALKTAETVGGPQVLFTWLSAGACLAGLKGKELDL